MSLQPVYDPFSLYGGETAVICHADHLVLQLIHLRIPRDDPHALIHNAGKVPIGQANGGSLGAEGVSDATVCVRIQVGSARPGVQIRPGDAGVPPVVWLQWVRKPSSMPFIRGGEQFSNADGFPVLRDK